MYFLGVGIRVLLFMLEKQENCGFGQLEGIFTSVRNSRNCLINYKRYLENGKYIQSFFCNYLELFKPKRLHKNMENEHLIAN
jgi:hypothetical protein